MHPIELIAADNARKLISNTLDAISRPCASADADVMFKNILCKVRQDSFADQIQLDTCQIQAEMNWLENAPFIKDIWGAIQEHRFTHG